MQDAVESACKSRDGYGGLADLFGRASEDGALTHDVLKFLFDYTNFVYELEHGESIDSADVLVPVFRAAGGLAD